MLIYLDTNIWVYAYEDSVERGGSARRLFQGIRKSVHQLATSYLVLGELLVLPTRKMDAFTQTSYRRLFSSPDLTMLPYDLAASEIYAQLRASLRIKPLDALHLAVAASAAVDLFLTEDTDLLSLTVPGIGTISDLSYTL